MRVARREPAHSGESRLIEAAAVTQSAISLELEIPMQRSSALPLVSLIAVLAANVSRGAEGTLSLMSLIAPWQYPGSKCHGASAGDAATVNRSGDRTVQSMLCKAVLTTADPVPKVIEYYRTKLKQEADLGRGTPEGESGLESARSVMFHEDSQDRPLVLHIILVNADKSSTTLVISRAETESETHIAWTHYLRF